MYGKKQDYLERQIEEIGRTLAAMLFGKDRLSTITEELEDTKSPTDVDLSLFNIQVNVFIDSDKILEMEELLFEAVNNNKSWSNLILALTFYNKISELSEEKLAKNGFSAEKIKESVQKLRKIFDEK